MENFKARLRKRVSATPTGRALWLLLAKIKTLGRKEKPDFVGWGMITHTFTPWYDGGGDDVARGFLKANGELSDKVKRGDFNLTQFSEVKDKEKTLRELMWRHYIVFWSVCYASKATARSVKNLVECGVCDGMSAFFAISAARAEGTFKAFLYDAWAGMVSEDLLDSEKKYVGEYSYLDVANTRRNLIAFQNDTSFIKGRVPDSFKTSDSPTEIVWMHIDLNSSLATTGALQFYYDRIVPGGIVLLDDYAWHGYDTTKLVADEFFQRKNGILFPLPTGQAIFFKR
jgi:O-methyltransferase